MTTTAGRHSARHAATHEADRRAKRPRGEGTPQAQGKTGAWWWITTILSWLVLLIVAFILLALVIIPRASGAQAYTVLTGSMTPNIDPGALVVVRDTPPEDLHAGDVITFQPYSGNPEVVTHRITGIFYNAQGEMQIHTQGDANNIGDSWVLVPDQVRGKLWYTVPQLGRLNSLLQSGTRSILITVVAGGLILYAVVMIGSGVRDRVRGRSEDGGHAAAGDAGDGDAGGSAEPAPGPPEDAGGEASDTDVGPEHRRHATHHTTARTGTERDDT